MNEINRNLLSLLLDKTNKKIVSWYSGSSNNEYKTDLNSATLVISLTFDFFDPLDPMETYTVNMYNGTGAPIVLASESEESPDFELMSRLFLAAKDSSTKESETITNLIDELNSLI